MPPRLSKPPDPQDPDYQRLERKINLMLHVAFFAASNTGVWFVRNILDAEWNWIGATTATWGMVLITHSLWVISKREK